MPNKKIGLVSFALLLVIGMAAYYFLNMKQSSNDYEPKFGDERYILDQKLQKLKLPPPGFQPTGNCGECPQPSAFDFYASGSTNYVLCFHYDVVCQAHKL